MRPRRILTFLILVLGTLTLGMTAASASVPSVPACSAGNMALSVNPNPGGYYAGGRVVYLLWQNTGPACRLGGYPGVSALGSLGRLLGNPAGRTGVPWTVQTFAPGQIRRSALQITDVGNYGPLCHHAEAYFIAGIPPANDAADYASFMFPACRNGGTTAPVYLHTGPLIPR